MTEEEAPEEAPDKISLLQEALESDMFISSISFDTESLQFDLVDDTKQSESVFVGETMVLKVKGNEELEEAYYHLQDLAQILVRDAHVTRREELNG